MSRFEKEFKQIAAAHGCMLYGYANLQGLTTGELANFYRGISFVFQMEPWVFGKVPLTCSLAEFDNIVLWLNLLVYIDYRPLCI